jgi:phage gpG-like protein
MVAVTVDDSSLNDLTARYAQIVPVMERELHVAMVRSTAQVQHDAQVAVPVDTGTLRRSITTNVTPYEGRVGTNLLYGKVVEEGRDKNKPMPPTGSLLGWMKRHGMNPKNEYGLRLRISQRGIKARPYLIPALEQNKAMIDKEFTLAIGRVLAQLGRRS